MNDATNSTKSKVIEYRWKRANIWANIQEIIQKNQVSLLGYLFMVIMMTKTLDGNMLESIS